MKKIVLCHVKKSKFGQNIEKTKGSAQKFSSKLNLISIEQLHEVFFFSTDRVVAQTLPYRYKIKNWLNFNIKKKIHCELSYADGASNSSLYIIASSTLYAGVQCYLVTPGDLKFPINGEIQMNVVEGDTDGFLFQCESSLPIVCLNGLLIFYM